VGEGEGETTISGTKEAAEGHCTFGVQKKNTLGQSGEKTKRMKEKVFARSIRGKKI